LRFSRKRQDGTAPIFFFFPFFQDLGENINLFIRIYNLHWKSLHPTFKLSKSVRE